MNIVITGGASGLGEAITHKLAGEKDNKVIFTYSKSKAEAEVLEKKYINVRAIKCDFTIPVEVEALKGMFSIFDIDVLVNNAYTGDFLKTYFHKLDSADFLKDFINNIIPTVIINQEAINCFRKKKSGKIITILTSALLDVPPVGSSIYVANKAYLEELTKIWATENAKYNITSNSVSPSFMLTNLTSGMDERVIEQIIENHPLKKLLTVDEVADTVEYFTKSGTQINGVNIVLNSGIHLK